MKNIKSLTGLYTVAIGLAIWPTDLIWLRVLAGLLGLAAVGLTLDLLYQDLKKTQTQNKERNALLVQINGLHERIEFFERDTTAALAAARAEELAEQVIALEARLAVLEEIKPDTNDSGTKDKASVYAGWPRGASAKTPNKKSGHGRNDRTVYGAVPVGKKFIEISDVLYPRDGSDKLFCAECYRSSKKTVEVSLREDRSAFFCEKCDTWIPTDPDDLAARKTSLKQALGTTRGKSSP